MITMANQVHTKCLRNMPEKENDNQKELTKYQADDADDADDKDEKSLNTEDYNYDDGQCGIMCNVEIESRNTIQLYPSRQPVNCGAFCNGKMLKSICDKKCNLVLHCNTGNMSLTIMEAQRDMVQYGTTQMVVQKSCL